MSSNELEKFRNEWKRELTQEDGQSERKKPDCQEPQSVITFGPSLDTIPSDQISSPANCKECNVHPAFRENDKCHTCIALNRETTEHKTSTKFYPFRIVDDLLNTGGYFKERNVGVNQNDLANKKTGQRGKKRKNPSYDDREMKDIFSKKGRSKKHPSERYLDLFIADLDEINDIPFFDLTVPREVAVKIFEPLDIKDLCRCSQVSKSWKSLADDELLWCRICHNLGYERDAQTVEKTKWKSVVKQHVEEERKLIYNWKNRLGSFSQLQYVHGGILCAVDSIDDTLVSGYTNGDVRLWNVEDDINCVFQPSNTSLVINEFTEDGTIPNNVTHIAVSPKFIVAGYRQGNVDVWKTEGKDCTKPVHVIDCQERRGLTDVGVAQYSDLVYCVSSPNDIGYVHIREDFTEDGFCKKKVVNVPQHIVSADVYEDRNVHSKPHIIVTTSFKVDLYKTDENQSDNQIFDHVTNIHHLIGSPVTCVSSRSSSSQLAIGLGSYGATIDPYRVKVYDLMCGKLISTLYNHTWTITCINLADSPKNLLITGSGDRRVRIFDMRTENMTHTFSGHSSQVNVVQMDELKAVSGGDDGFVRVWDLRMSKKLWEIHNRHPVKHCRFTKNRLIIGNVPTNTLPIVDEFESATHRRYRGSIQVYDFSVDQATQGVPEICLSTYDEPEASHYNIGLAMPYDKL